MINPTSALYRQLSQIRAIAHCACNLLESVAPPSVLHPVAGDDPLPEPVDATFMTAAFNADLVTAQASHLYALVEAAVAEAVPQLSKARQEAVAAAMAAGETLAPLVQEAR